MALRREQVSALFFVAWTQRLLTECFPWATEGPNPPKETLTFKKEFFWQTTPGSLPAGLKLDVWSMGMSMKVLPWPKKLKQPRARDTGACSIKHARAYSVRNYRSPTRHWRLTFRVGDHQLATWSPKKNKKKNGKNRAVANLSQRRRADRERAFFLPLFRFGLIRGKWNSTTP